VAFHRVAALRDLRDGRGRAVWVGTRRVAVFRVGERLFASSNTCPHAGGSLVDGRLLGCVVECPRHQWRFDLRTGDCPDHGIYHLRTYAVEVRGDDVYVAIPEDPW
jgi:nitrite reductase (NADH) small subunit